MPNFSFEETARFFANKINQNLHPEDIEAGKMEMMIDTFPILISQGHFEGSLMIETILGLYVKPFHEERLKELALSNFFNINTGGCTLALNDVSVLLRCSTSSATTPRQNWEWLHKILIVAREWHHVMTLWDEFIPLISSEKR